jgi:hypothetical protein
MTLTNCFGQNPNKIEALLESRKDLFGNILDSPLKYEVQIIYTQIDRDAHNRPHFRTYTFNVDKDRYFYPASLVKLPVALLAMEKINHLKIKGLTKYSSLQIDSVRKPQTKVEKDTTAKFKAASIAHYIKKIFVASDNDAFNRLYEFLGQEYINETLWHKGYKDVLIINRLANADFDAESNRYTNPIRFYEDNKVIYQQPEIYNSKTYPSFIKQPLKGIAHYDKKGKYVAKPFDFSKQNYMSLQTMHDLLKTVIFPETTEHKKRFHLTPTDYQYLYKCMSMLPRESKYPKYTKDFHQDGFMKYILYGDTKEVMPANIRIFNKVGQSYGFLVENAYVVDFEAKTEFMVSAVIYTNENKILNDGKYEYKEIGFPFFVNLGKVIAWHEKNRERKYLPDLNKFKVNYEE